MALFFPMVKKIIQLDAKNQYLKTINIGYQDNISSDKYNSLFEFDPVDNLFYITLHRDTYERNQYNNIPLVGAFNLKGELVSSFGEYPENYKNLEGDKSAWKFSFFDKDEDFYYAMFNRNNYIYKYDNGFNLIEKIRLPRDFIAEKDYHGKILNAFKKQPERNVFFLITNETFLQTDGTEGVYVDLKWFNADNNTYGILPLKNYMRIHQITEEGTLILLDRNSYDDAYFYFYDFSKKGS
jgi:hypothetical protein